MTNQQMKKCPHCAEMIFSEANVCRYCGKDVRPEMMKANEVYRGVATWTVIGGAVFFLCMTFVCIYAFWG